MTTPVVATRARAATAAPARTGGRTQQRTPRPLPPPRPPSRPAPASATAAGGRTGGRTQQGTQGGRRASTTRPQPPKPKRRDIAIPGGGKLSDYQPVILGEFVAAVLLTAATPFATPSDKAGLSPYAGADMVKLTALTVLYLILALVSLGGRGAGRMAAWFGGLILLTVGLAEAANLAKTLNIFGGPVPAPEPDTFSQGAGIVAGALPGTTEGSGSG
jgi:hypothetical protein